ncbi:hypothetical protein GCM10010282_30870 [Streptomyces roseolus]|nr:hypothetical protein GCM10010282_30870 [Streptomyces roseolus]
MQAGASVPVVPSVAWEASAPDGWGGATRSAGSAGSREGSAGTTEVEECFDGPDAASRDAFRRIRAIAPGAEDGRSHGTAALRHGGEPLLRFRAGREHVSAFPFIPEAVDAVRERPAGFGLSKGTARFTADHPSPTTPSPISSAAVRPRSRAEPPTREPGVGAGGFAGPDGPRRP